ncbi:MAG: hypothetical protein AAGH79_15895 [Bacteroidota bacterium]
MFKLMKNGLFAFLALGVTFASCNKEEMHSDYNVDIEIMSPAEGAEVTMGEVMHTHVVFSREEGETVHNVVVEVLDANGEVVATLIDDHVHTETSYEFHSMEFTPTEMGELTIRATSYDHGDKSTSVTQERTVTVVHGHGGAEYAVSITIMSPTEGASVTAGENLHVHVEYAHDNSETIHHVKVQIMDMDGNVLSTLAEDHVHEDSGAYAFHSMEYVPADTGSFMVRAASSNHDQSVEKHAMAMFTVE